MIILGENWIIGENSGKLDKLDVLQCDKTGKFRKTGDYYWRKLGTWFMIGEDMLDVGSSPE